MVLALLLLAAASPLPALTDGVRTVAMPGIPGVVHALRADSVPFLVGKSGRQLRPVAVAGTLGKGRVAAFAHDGYLGEGALGSGDTLRLMQNTIRWAAGKTAPKVGYSGMGAEAIRKLGFETVDLSGDGWKSVDVVVAPICPDPAKVRALLARGGGAIGAMCPWGWSMLNPGKKLYRDLNWNPIMADAGLVLADGMVEDVRPVVDDAEAGSLNAEMAMRSPKGPSLDLLAEAVRSVGSNHPLRRRAETVAGKAALSAPTEKAPFGKDQSLERLALVLRHLRQQEGRGPAVDPASSDFPGAVTTRERVSKDVTVRSDVGHWQSTGLYAAPGDKVSITVPKSVVGKGLRLQIGVHSDENWHHEQWTRHPSIVVSQPIDREKTVLSSPFGGLVIVAVDRPAGVAQFVAKIENVVPAPRFVLGKTTSEEWAAERKKPGPWAEFESKSMIVTVPSETARKIADPKPLMELWERTMGHFEELDGLRFDRAERLVADRQISAGYMHSGYPIMTWLDVTDLVTNPGLLTTAGSWGHWHELGHNRQSGLWTFDGSGEVTNNLFTMYAYEKIAGRGVWDRLGKDKDAKLKAHLAKGAPFQAWQSDPFLALTMYAQLIDAFGWEPLKRVFRTYQGVNGNGWTEERKRDEWMTRYSREIGKDLGGFFQAWGVPTSAEARERLKDLPGWMPSDWPGGQG